MSNCIWFEEGGDVFFGQTVINVIGYKALLEEAEDKVNSRNSTNENTDSDLRCAWWFLSKNSHFTKRGVLISFGDGRSGHTWRDFKWTLKVLSKCMKVEKKYRFVMTDEYDGRKEKFNVIVKFKDGKIVDNQQTM